MLSLKEIISRFTQQHGNCYDYSKVIYRGVGNPVEILCFTHGSFHQRPQDHFAGQGCPECGKSKRAKTATSTAEEFVDKAQKIHDTYSYANVVYTRSNAKVSITCPIHGDFLKTPNKHLMGQGCPACTGYKGSTRRNTEDFISQAIEIHGDKYDYSQVEYITIDDPVNVICPVHGLFKTIPYHHLKGGQCSSCAHYGFKYNQPAIFYYVKIVYSDHTYYKVGVTNKTLKERFSLPEFEFMTVLKTTDYKTGREAFCEEQKIIKQFKQFSYKGNRILKSNGNSELFVKDVLELDFDNSS